MSVAFPTVDETPQPLCTVKRYVQSGLPALTIPFAILSIVPAFRLVGSIGTRSVSLLTSILNFTGSINKENKWLHVTNTLQIGAVVAGIVALTASVPFLIIVSIVTDIAIQTIELGKAIYQKRWKAAAIHAFQIIIDAFVLASILQNSLLFMLIAFIINTAFIFTIYIVCEKDLNKFSHFDFYCKLILFGVSVANANLVYKTEHKEVRGHGRHKHTVTVEDWPGLPTNMLPTVPLGGAALVTRDVDLD